MKTETYRLWSAETSGETIRIAMENEWSSITDERVLVYKRGGKPGESFTMIPEKAVAKELTEQESAWLRNTNIAVMRDFTERHMKENLHAQQAFLKRFDLELEKEREKLKEGADDGNGYQRT